MLASGTLSGRQGSVVPGSAVPGLAQARRYARLLPSRLDVQTKKLFGTCTPGTPAPRSRVHAPVVARSSASPLGGILGPSPTFRVQLIQPTGVARSEDCDKLLVYLPGTDGTGQAILPQIPALRSQGYDTWCLYMPPDDRSDWEQLTTQVTLLLRQLLADWRAGHEQQQQQRQVGADANNSGGEGAAAAPPQRPPPRITIIAESFGCCLALRLAASGAAPELLDRLVLLNPATSFNRSLSGLSSLIAASNLLSLFPRDWYSVAQTTLLPLLVDGGRVEPANQELLQSMIQMEPPSCSQSFGFGSGFTNAAVAPGAAYDDYSTAAGYSRRTPTITSNGPSSGSISSAGGLWERRYGSLNGVGGSSNDGGGSSSGGGGPATLYYGPAAAANFRTNLLRTGDPGEEALARVRTPVLMVTSARDRLLPSIAEGARLERQLPYCRRHILPDSGHAAMLERGMDITRVMAVAGFLGELPDRPAPAPAVAAAAARRAVPQPAVAGVGGAVEAGGVGAMAAGAGWPGDADSWHMSSGVGSSISGISSSSPAAPSPYTNGNGAPAMPTASFASSSNGASSGSSSSSAVGRGAGRAGAAGAGNGNGNGAGEEGPGASGRDTDSAFDEWCQNLAPWRDLISPVVLGFSNLPPPGSADFERPMLFVGNHQKMGFYDTPLLVYELYVRGYRVRGLAHPGHWAGPFGKWFESFGAVKASPMAAFRLLRGREKVLLFPGGAKEVVKKRGQEYTLLWKDSPDFVRLAAKCDALIVPFAAVGADDAYDVIMDTDEVISHPLLGPLTQGLLARVSSALAPEESIFPITRLPVVGLPTPIPIPNLQRLYFKFAPPVDPRRLGTDIHNPQQVQQLYDGVKDTVTQCMGELLEVRAADEESQVGERLARSLRRMAPVLGAAVAPPPSPPPSLR
ncbi:hypothetical protein CHLRE_01g017100v5 [Chlamydomonas reinhardtii]|uniref:Phospholipid/glycerol acyltransferase domain-containing protein n=1 Tax=Chlamydomonas reinhardtii TaxID=3055 RepID=A0A2K3E5X6_CHLRE|nr:uncharacterized protein CHLRE_01g017100v5 [Chlamydomonas reinhardtii]PNW88163.1 hypothetical protein CHLRE_01g017100v5 [Chlamydomonas reinhardtii]